MAQHWNCDQPFQSLPKPCFTARGIQRGARDQPLAEGVFAVEWFANLSICHKVDFLAMLGDPTGVRWINFTRFMRDLPALDRSSLGKMLDPAAFWGTFIL